MEFAFQSHRFEVWSNGTLVSQRNVHNNLKCQPSVFMPGKCTVSVDGLPASLNMKSSIMFDIVFTSTDRVYLATVPERSNINNYDSFLAFKRNVPNGFPIVTRSSYDFDETQPYVCSVYTKNSMVVKVSFSFGNNPRLIEFYIADDNGVVAPTKEEVKLAIRLLDILIEKWDDDSRVSEQYVIGLLSDETTTDEVDEGTINNLIYIINQIGNAVVVRRFTQEYMMNEIKVLITEHTRYALRAIRQELLNL